MVEPYLPLQSNLLTRAPCPGFPLAVKTSLGIPLSFPLVASNRTHPPGRVGLPHAPPPSGPPTRPPGQRPVTERDPHQPPVPLRHRHRHELRLLPPIRAPLFEAFQRNTTVYSSFTGCLCSGGGKEPPDLHPIAGIRSFPAPPVEAYKCSRRSWSTQTLVRSTN